MAARDILKRCLLAVACSSLAGAFAAVGAGLVGLLEARDVSLITLVAAGVGLVSASGYFGLAEQDLRRKFSSAT